MTLENPQRLTLNVIQNDQQPRLLRGVPEVMSDPLYVIDVESYRIALANKAARELGVGEAQTCYALTHRRDTPCDGRNHPCPLKMVRQNNQPAVVEHIHYDKDGRLRNMEVHAFPLLDDDGRLTHTRRYHERSSPPGMKCRGLRGFYRI